MYTHAHFVHVHSMHIDWPSKVKCIHMHLHMFACEQNETCASVCAHVSIEKATTASPATRRTSLEEIHILRNHATPNLKEKMDRFPKNFEGKEIHVQALASLHRLRTSL